MYFEAENVRMIEWLKNQPVIIMHAAAISLNWDFAEGALEWIAKSGKIDEATASALFFLSCPSNHFPYRSKSPDGTEKVWYPSHPGEGIAIANAIAQRWIAGTYLKGQVELDHGEGYRYSERKNHPEVYFYLSSQKEFGPLGQMPWPELIGIEGPFLGEKPKPLLEYFKEDEAETFRIFAMQEDLGTSQVDLGMPYSQTSSSKLRYSEWRIANGFGEQPSWKRG